MDEEEEAEGQGQDERSEPEPFKEPEAAAGQHVDMEENAEGPCEGGDPGGHPVGAYPEPASFEVAAAVRAAGPPLPPMEGQTSAGDEAAALAALVPGLGP